MSLIEIVLIAVGLAMDCFAVSIASSIAYGRYNWGKILRMAFFFGLFQGVMPFVGWLAGVTFADAISKVDHWVAFLILGYLGGKMIYESCIDKDKGYDDSRSPYGSIKMLLILSVATSIDALASGLIFVPFGNMIFTASSVIFICSFIFTFAGCIIGVSSGKRFNVNVEAIGGVILLLIGVKILVEHLFFC